MNAKMGDSMGWNRALLRAASRSPAFTGIVNQMSEGRSISVSGIYGPSLVYLLDVLRVRLGKPFIVVTCGNAEAERIASDMETIAGDVYGFPPWETLPDENTEPHADIVGERFLLLQRLLEERNVPEKCVSQGEKKPLIIVTQFRSFAQRIAPPEMLASTFMGLRCGMPLAVDTLVHYLQQGGYRRVDMVEEKGEYCVRGGLVDLFPPIADYPLRLEFFGDEIETIRSFHTQTQRSIAELSEAAVTPFSELGLIIDHRGELGSLIDYLPSDAVIAVHEPAEGLKRLRDAGLHGDFFLSPEEVEASFTARQSLYLSLVPEGPVKRSRKRAIELDFESLETYRSTALGRELGTDLQKRVFGHLRDWAAKKMDIVIFCNNVGEKTRLQDLLEGQKIRLTEASGIFIGRFSEGFVFREGRLVVLTDGDIFGRYKVRRPRRRFKGTLAIREFSELRQGDFVVHVRYGIGIYRGVKRIVKESEEREFLCIEYQDEAKLYVPLEQACLVERYIGLGKSAPHLDRLGGKRWQDVRKAAQRAIFDFAAELLELQAARSFLHGYAYSADTDWQREFEQAFVYEETPDQDAAISDVKHDMERPQPMDRLICGDVGYGKTEVAMRAAFKAVMGGKQVAVLVPTTVLAQQHLQTFSERIADYPLRIEMLSRFRTLKEQRLVLKGLREGSVDIVIGTHRLTQPDVRFKDLGLMIIDEEQRFGVRHKERLKRLRMTVDVLTLTATPIPRTLYMSMTGIRDMSTISTPPEDRLAIETVVSEYSVALIREAIRREINRQGQVYYVHNFVETIERVKERLEGIVPEATYAVAHGQMADDELEEVMRTFVEGKVDVLVCTTIIESGLDIPNANTIIIDRADRFGLADLYQLRGRVGRYKHRAYSYFLYSRGMGLVRDARKRLKAIMEHSSLGSGFKLALRDLEIRGAGNILGVEQHGHVTAIGFDLYCKLLKRSVASLTGKEVKGIEDIEVRFPFTEEIPAEYIPAVGQRIDIYKRLGEITTLGDVDEIAGELRDRFGEMPEAAKLVLETFRLKLATRDRGIHSVHLSGGKIIAVRAGAEIRPGGRYPRVHYESPLEAVRQVREALEKL
jgi:transcription-repair coupling factor (superfamily II helicase)